MYNKCLFYSTQPQELPINENSTMQLFCSVVLTIAAFSLLSSAVIASPVLLKVNDETSLDELKTIAAEQENEYKRICGMSLICRPYPNKVSIFIILTGVIY